MRIAAGLATGAALTVAGLSPSTVVAGAQSIRTTADAHKGGVHALVSPAYAAAQRQAHSLALLLAESTRARSAITAASKDLENCAAGGKNLSADAKTFESAASERRDLIGSLNALDVAAIPGGRTLVSGLLAAWNASVASDQAYAGYANDEALKPTCVPNDPSDASFRAAQSDDQRASATKRDFLSLWNPVAERYGQPTYTQNQI